MPLGFLNEISDVQKNNKQAYINYTYHRKKQRKTQFCGRIGMSFLMLTSLKQSTVQLQISIIGTNTLQHKTKDAVSYPKGKPTNHVVLTDGFQTQEEAI